MQTFTPVEYLKIDIASNFGLDKEDWDTRLAWFDANEHQLDQLLAAAEEPALFYAGVQAYAKAIKGESIGYPISLDATASGLQLLAIMTGCEASARLCNVISTGHREDAYTTIYSAMKEILEGGDLSYQPGDNVKLPNTSITRADCKQAIMTSLYSSTAIPKKVFGKGEQLAVFYATMESMAPGAWSLNQGLRSLWQPYAPSHDWVLPDNFHVHTKVESQVTKYIQVNNVPVAVDMVVNQGTKEGRALSPNIVHSIDGLVVREMHRRCTFDVKRLYMLAELISYGYGSANLETEDDRMVQRLWQHYQDSGFLSARILNHLNEDNIKLVDADRILELLRSMPDKPFRVLSVHDCFRVHPNYGNDLRRQYNQILSELAASDILSSIVSQILGRHVPITKMADLADRILEADYALS